MLNSLILISNYIKLYVVNNNMVNANYLYLRGNVILASAPYTGRAMRSDSPF